MCLLLQRVSSLESNSSETPAPPPQVYVQVSFLVEQMDS